MDFPPEVHSCKAEGTIKNTGRHLRHLWKPWVWLTAFCNSCEGSRNWEISPILQEVTSKICFDQPILACIQQLMRPLSSPVGLCSLVNLCHSHGKAKLDFNQTFMTAMLELETTRQWNSYAEQCTGNVLGIPQKCWDADRLHNLGN